MQPILRRVDPQIDLDFGYGGPAQVGSDYFHVEWTSALLVPNEGDYTLYLASDDGSELWRSSFSRSAVSSLELF